MTDVLYVKQAGAPPRADLRAWNARGLNVITCAVDAVPSRSFDRVVVDGLDAVTAFSIDRSLRLSATPIVIVCDQVDGIELDEADRRAWNRFATDRRVSWIFRSKWHVDAAGISSARTHVITRDAPDETHAPPPSAKLRVVCPRSQSDAAHDAVDLYVRTVWLLKDHPRFSEFEFAESGVADVVFLPARERSDEPLALEFAARGAAIVATDVGGVGEALPPSALIPNADPAICADALVALLDRKRLKKLQKEHGAFARRVSTQHDQEVAVVTASPKRAEKRKMATPVLSVIVPAWNATPHLERCVHSLTRGSLDGLEIVIVNDGSTDATAELGERLTNQFPGTVRVVSQRNRGHGGAINTGLLEARGSWFRVIDADDWVDAPAFAALLEVLMTETRADLVLTDYAEVRPELSLPRRVPLFERLPAGALCGFEGITHPRYGLTSWGPILSTSTFRTEVLRRAGLRLTENSAYVDLEYCTLGLEFVQTFRVLDLDLYRYSLGSDTQSVSASSYGERFKQHEAVIMRLCEFVSTSAISPAKRAYIEERVIAPVVLAHLEILRKVLKDAKEEQAFRERMRRFPFIDVPQRSAIERARAALKSALPPGVKSLLMGARRYFD